MPHSPPSLPVGGDESEPEGFNDSTVSSDVPLGSGLPTASQYRNNRALFCQIKHIDDETKHVDDHTSAWNKRRNNQATQWNTVAIPRLMPIYLANHAATESGRLPPPPKPNHQLTESQVVQESETLYTMSGMT